MQQNTEDWQDDFYFNDLVHKACGSKLVSEQYGNGSETQQPQQMSWWFLILDVEMKVVNYN